MNNARGLVQESSRRRDVISERTSEARSRAVVEVESWAVRGPLPAPVDADNLPRFHYIHKPEGSPAGLRFEGVAPTGPLPDPIEFPLHDELVPGQNAP